MGSLRARRAPWHAVACAVLAGATAASGCQSIIGIHDVSLDPGAGGGTSSASSASSSAGTGGASTSTSASTSASTSSTSTSTSSASTSASSTSSGTAQDFAFAITDVTVNVPYKGLNYVDLSITPSGGFNAAVDITVAGGPNGLVVKPLTIPAGATTGKLQVGADTTLGLGTKFTITITATSGALSHTASAPAVVTGKPGDLDMAFGSAGLVAGPTGTGYVNLNDIREVAQNKILVGGLSAGKLGGGNMIGLRYLANGSADTTFNGTGSVSASYCGCTKGQGGAIGVAREIDGTLLFVGWGDAGSGKTDDIYLFRYHDDGTFSTAQGDNGTEPVDLGGEEEVTAVGLVPNSTNVIVAGTKDGRFFVSRIPDRQAGGSPDVTFSPPNGFITPAFGGSGGSAGALKFDAQGRIVLTGWYMTGTDDDLVVVRLGPDGALDATFGTGGIVKLARTGNQHGTAILVEPNGTILVAATTDEGGVQQILVQHFLATGALDTKFGTNGAVLVPLGAGGSGPALMVQMVDGRIVVGATGTIGGTSGAVFGRMFPDGTADPTFGTNGGLAVYVGSQSLLQAMSLAGDGKLLIAGSNSSNPGASFIARVWN